MILLKKKIFLPIGRSAVYVFTRIPKLNTVDKTLYFQRYNLLADILIKIHFLHTLGLRPFISLSNWYNQNRNILKNQNQNKNCYPWFRNCFLKTLSKLVFLNLCYLYIVHISKIRFKWFSTFWVTWAIQKLY